jgi:NTP pyrophosphatase (non-canonical NTP hydrolase)
MPESITMQILEEVKRARGKFPQWPNDPLHAVSILNEEVGELNKAIYETIYEPEKSNHEDVREEAIQVAASSIRFLMSLDKYVYVSSVQHLQER